MRVIDTVGMGARFEAVPLKIPAVPQPGREAIRFRFAAGHLWHKLRFVLDSPLEEAVTSELVSEAQIPC